MFSCNNSVCKFLPLLELFTRFDGVCERSYLGLNLFAGMHCLTFNTTDRDAARRNVSKHILGSMLAKQLRYHFTFEKCFSFEFITLLNICIF